jgi:hypothetical protein
MKNCILIFEKIANICIKLYVTSLYCNLPCLSPLDFGLANYSFEVIHANYKFNLNKIINLNKCTSTTSSVGLVCKLRDTKF